MNSNALKLGLWWLLKAAILVTLSLVVIFLSSPKAHAATITGNLITSGGAPALKLGDDSIVSFSDSLSAQRFWVNVGNQVKLDCAVRNSIVSELRSVIVVGSGERIWGESDAVSGDQTGQGGGLIVKQPDKIEGRLIVRHTQPAVDITPRLLYGGYGEVTLGNLGSVLTAELLKLADGYGSDIIAEGELDGLVIYVDNLWVNGVQLKRA